MLEQFDWICGAFREVGVFVDDECLVVTSIVFYFVESKESIVIGRFSKYPPQIDYQFSYVIFFSSRKK